MTNRRLLIGCAIGAIAAALCAAVYLYTRPPEAQAVVVGPPLVNPSTSSIVARPLDKTRLAGIDFNQSSAGVRQLPARSDDGATDDWGISNLGPTNQGTLRCLSTDQACGNECLNFSDCPVGNACLLDLNTHLLKCIQSVCTKDSDCPPGNACSLVSSDQQPDLVRICLSYGPQKEGEACVNAYGGAHCAAGLVCHHLTCMRQCSDASDCPDSTCADVKEGRVCLPNCSVSGCPEGFRCLELGKASFCVKEIGENCFDKKICAEGEECVAMHDTDAREVRFGCYRRCSSATGAGCKSDEVCGLSAVGSVCYKACKPNDPAGCGAGELCVGVTENMDVFGCRPQ